MIYRTDADAIAGLLKWQRLLHLQDWEIAVMLVPQTTAWTDRGQCGECIPQGNKYAADIRLATIDSLDLVGCPEQADMERTLVHELLHCIFRGRKLWASKPADHELNHYEHGIEQIARAFVELDRRIVDPPRPYPEYPS